MVKTANNSSSVTYPDRRLRIYHWNESAYLSGVYRLAGTAYRSHRRVDGRFATYNYSVDREVERTRRIARFDINSASSSRNTRQLSTRSESLGPTSLLRTVDS